ncbi:MAG: hypothetical protein JWM46_752 [Candidatus Kaiserbacteria bacterium]|nr:hypothetical protein [Candidatus Kaiserbacteria bacterium]
MAKDYFQDIVPPSNDHIRRAPRPVVPETPEPVISSVSDEDRDEEFDQGAISEPSERSIRNIQVTPRAPRRIFPDRDTREVPPVGMGMPRRPRKTRWWIWGTAVACVVALGLLLFVAMRPTTVKVTPRSQALTFDSSSQFTAYPAISGATDSLTYSTQESDLTDSQTVASQGTVHAEDKASGNITIYNAYQTTPLKLIATTRFETADGHVFRVPVDVVVPSMVGTTPGQVTVTVQADKAGADYNVGASKFTLPGLKSNTTMYAKVYAQSTESMVGGFVGDKPGVADGARQAAISSIRTRLEAKANAAAASTNDLLIFPDLMQITYRDLPDTSESDGSIRINESAHVSVPAFTQTDFAAAVAQASSIDTSGATLTLVPSSDFGAQNIATSTAIGTDPLQFSLTGKAVMVWNVDAGALQRSLAGKSDASFQTIVAGIPSIQQASARVEPFWKGTFPDTASAIKVEISKPLAQ